MSNCTKEPQNDAVKPKDDAIDLISRQAALQVLKRYYPSPPFFKRNRENWEEKYRALVLAEEAIARLPSVERTGKWIADMKMFGIEFYKCDKCGFRQSEKSNFCPNCGARMLNGGE